MAKEKKLKTDVDIKDLFKKKQAKDKVTNADSKIVNGININNQEKFIPAPAEVNFVPKATLEAYKATDLRRLLTMTTGGVIALFILLWGGGFVLEQTNKMKIKEIDASTAKLNTDSQKYKPYESFVNAVEAKRTTMAGTMANELNLPLILNDFNQLAKSANFKVLSYDLSGGSAAAAPTADGVTASAGNCINPNPFSTATGIACISFTLDGAGDLDKMYLASEKSDSTFLNFYVPNLTSSEEKKTFAGTIAIKDGKYSLDRAKDLRTPLTELLGKDDAAKKPAESTNTDGGN